MLYFDILKDKTFYHSYYAISKRILSEHKYRNVDGWA